MERVGFSGRIWYRNWDLGLGIGFEGWGSGSWANGWLIVWLGRWGAVVVVVVRVVGRGYARAGRADAGEGLRCHI